MKRASITHSTARLTAAGALAGVAAGGALRLAGIGRAGDLVLAATTVMLLVPLTSSVARALLRGDVGVDTIALVSMVGALILGEYLAGAVIALMLAGGNALEEAANRRASRALTALVERAPRVALVRHGDDFVETDVQTVSAGDVVLVRAGEVVAVDGMVESDEVVVDESALTGEPLPVTVVRGGQIRSGVANAGPAFELRALRPAAESAYASLVRLVGNAERERAPFVRMADRFAALLLPTTAAVAGLAWAVSGDPVRALAVFVVATPCPLILAAPVAFRSGLSRAAHIGIVVKSSAVIEALGRTRTVLLDKTGTITLGRPVLTDIVPLDDLLPDEILRLAASLDRLSTHPMADALVEGSRQRGLQLALATKAEEAFGRGILGVVNGHQVVVGSLDWVTSQGVGTTATPVAPDGSAAVVAVAVDGRLAGLLLVDDLIRDDASGLVEKLRAVGVDHLALVTGDNALAAGLIGEALGIDRVYADQSPEQKLEVVRTLKGAAGRGTVVMVGDGINDAPALALADVGIALGTLGATIASETADAVILVNRVDRIVDAIRIGRRSLSIAQQSVLLGIAASFVAMAFAAAGLLPPTEGALLQEGIDVAVILNALRASSG